MRIGYARVSTRDQHPEAQADALHAAGCERVFTDKASGKLARRPELDKALLVLRKHDQLVVTKLDRLGRSLEHLIELAGTFQTRGVHLVVLDQGVDTSTAVGRMFFQILGAVAEFEHALKWLERDATGDTESRPNRGAMHSGRLELFDHDVDHRARHETPHLVIGVDPEPRT